MDMDRKKELKEMELRLQEVMRYIEGISTSIGIIYDTNLKFSGSLEELNKELEEMFVKIQLFIEASQAIMENVGTSRGSLSHATDLLEDIVVYYRKLLKSSESALKGFESLESMGTKIVELLEKLEAINIVSLSTARNAEIKAYHSGEGGKGFEVVARELGEFTRESIELVQNIMDSIKKIKDESQNVKEHFSKFEEPINKIEEEVSLLKENIDFIRDSFKKIEDFSNLVSSEGEKQDRLRGELQHYTTELSEASKKLLLNSSRANFVSDQKVGIGETLSFLFNNLVDTHGKETFEQVAGDQFLSYLNIISSLVDVVDGEINSLNIEKIKETLKFKGVEELKTIIEKQENLAREITSYANESITSAKNLSEHISRMLERNKVLGDTISAINTTLKNAIEGFNALRKQSRNASSSTENLRILSLYAKLEAVRANNENLLVIVEQMGELSHEFKSVSKEIEDFVSGIKDSITLTSQGIGTMSHYIEATGSDFEKSLEYLNSATKKIDYITNISEELNKTVAKQKEIIENFLDTFTALLSEIENTIGVFHDIQDALKSERVTLQDLKTEFSSKDFHISIPTFTLVLSETGDPVNLDPAYIGDSTSNTFVNNLYRGLFEFGFTAKVYATASEFIKISDDGKRITIRLRRGLKAHNNSSISAEDVEFSFKRVLNAPNAMFFEAIKDLKVIDNLTFEILLKYPYVPIFSNLATIAGAIVPKDAGNLESKPIGIGPFKFLEWKKGDFFALERFNDYVGGMPYADRLIYKIVKDSEEAIERFKMGEIDIIDISLSSLPMLEKDIELKRRMLRVNSFDIQYLAFCFNKIKGTPFEDVRVRRAMSHMVDREKFLEELYMGHGTPAKGVFPPGLEVYNPALRGYDYNPEKAKELMKEAGYPEGIPDTYFIDVSDTKTNVRRAEILVEQFKKFGIKLEIRARPWGEFLDFVHKGQAILFMLGWNTDNGDPDNFLFPLFHSKSIGEPGNASFYSNPEVDKLIELGMRELNPQKRIGIYREAEKKILEDAPMIFLNHAFDVYLVQKNIRGFKPNPISNGTHLEFVYKE